MRKGGDPFYIVLSPCFRVVVRVSVLSHVPRAIMHTSVVVCVGRLSCWGGGDRRGGGGGRGRGGDPLAPFPCFFSRPHAPPNPPRARPSPPLLMLTSRVLFRPRPLRCVCCPARIVCLNRRVYLILVCVCVGYADDVAKTIATSGGIEAVARAMTVHADDNDVQEWAVRAIANVVSNIPAHIAMAKAAGVVPLLRRAVAMGVRKGASGGNPAVQLKMMGV